MDTLKFNNKKCTLNFKTTINKINKNPKFKNLDNLFSPLFLQPRNPEIINYLSDNIKNNLKPCWLCFLPIEHENRAEHYDEHFRENRRIKKLKNERSWYGTFRKNPYLTEVRYVRAKSALESRMCFYCREELESRYFDDDDEEWYFVNAIEKDFRIYHPHCRS